ncbi:MAG: LD-carboxypeptidase [Lachnospiraceae bacterium]|nr:LD-carboxypeptidase [Lachnospiraceae bacterium]
MKIPSFLPENGTIGYVAPSFGCNIEPYKTCFNEAMRKFEELGYVNYPGPNVFKGEGIGISNTPEKCAEELTNFYSSEDTDILIACGGGELMCEILPFVDFEKISNSEPKWYMGYSDNTNFTLLLNTICDTASIYGPCAPSFGPNWHRSHKEALSLLKGELKEVSNYISWEMVSLKTEANPLTAYNLTEKNCVRCMKISNPEDEDVNAAMTGRLIGGCLDCLVTLCGTKFDKIKEFNERYKEEGIIWFLESCDLNMMGVRRALFQLKNAGWFENTKGFIIGRPLHFDEPMFGLDRFKAYMEPLMEFNVPVIMDADIGHLPPQMPIVSGALSEVRYEAEERKLHIKYLDL